MKTIALADRPRRLARRGAGRPGRRRHPLPALAPDRLRRLRRGRHRHAERHRDRVDGDGAAGGRRRRPAACTAAAGAPRRRTWRRTQARGATPTTSSAGSWRSWPPATTRRASPAATWWRRCAPRSARHGRIGPAANSTYWGVLALRAAGSSVPARTLALHPRAPAPKRRLRMVAERGAGLERHGGRRARAARGRRRAAAAGRSHTPSATSAPRRRRRTAIALLPGARGRQPVDVVGDPGTARLRPAQPALARVAARPPAAERRVQLPARHDDHPGLRDRPGAARPCTASGIRSGRPPQPQPHRDRHHQVDGEQLQALEPVGLAAAGDQRRAQGGGRERRQLRAGRTRA